MHHCFGGNLEQVVTLRGRPSRTDALGCGHRLHHNVGRRFRAPVLSEGGAEAHNVLTQILNIDRQPAHLPTIAVSHRVLTQLKPSLCRTVRLHTAPNQLEAEWRWKLQTELTLETSA